MAPGHCRQLLAQHGLPSGGPEDLDNGPGIGASAGASVHGFRGSVVGQPGHRLHWRKVARYGVATSAVLFPFEVQLQVQNLRWVPYATRVLPSFMGWCFSCGDGLQCPGGTKWGETK